MAPGFANGVRKASIQKSVAYLFHPIGRFGKPAEIGEAVKWMLSDSASFVTGAAVAMDGGYRAL